MKMKELEYALRNMNEYCITEEEYPSAVTTLADLCIKGLPTDLVECVAPLVRQLIGRFGVITPAHRNKMHKLCLDADEQMNIREGCLAYLMHIESRLDDGKCVFSSLSESERIELSGPWIRPMVMLASVEGPGSFPRVAINSVVAHTTDLNKYKIIKVIEGYARQYGTNLDELNLRSMVPDEH